MRTCDIVSRHGDILTLVCFLAFGVDAIMSGQFVDRSFPSDLPGQPGATLALRMTS